MARALIVVPTYNEAENIKPLLDSVNAHVKEADVLFVDDNSPDGTSQIIEEIRGKYPFGIFLLKRPKKEGIGPAYIDGFKWAIARSTQYDAVIECDADLSHDPAYIPLMLQELKNGTDVVIGSRYVNGGGIENWPLNRVLLSRMAALYVNIILRFGIKDPTSGFVAYSMEALKKLNLNKIRSKGYAFQIEMKYSAFKMGLKIKEIPITFRDRKYGTSKMSLAIFHEAFFGVLKMPWRDYT